ncbi:ubiquinone biosynthesis accessory factor UbiJ [Leucothrix pacifica]|uniref:Ubiquinone biosynthesis accessory factor UbiJ n=1 Tax=Leucothrix pacifica TaxID=1247513 RepID=A0A317CEA2_9GAMM|nr:SCP2 sterol-binding domain-containing protein [Leucothrix pacifica]PWQ97025.1 Sterol-binding domain protein [Leucothrix pacifica]
MKLPVLLLALLERSLNAYLRLDGEAFSRSQSLQGKIIALHIKNLDWTLYCLAGAEDIQVMSEYGGEPDATISGSIGSLIRLNQSEDSASAMLESDVEIKGELQVAQAFSRFLSEASIDWEEMLSRVVGDIPAHQVGNFVRSGNEWVKESAESMKLNTSEYLSEESRLVVAEAELDEFIDDVDELRMAADRLEARINALQHRQDKESQPQ